MSDLIQTLTIPAVVHGRFLVRQPSTETSRGLLVGCHGYAEDAASHFAELEQVTALADWTVVAAQALHPFYNSRSGDVVASWMTKLDREMAIEENVQYISDVVGQVRVGGLLAAPLVYLGFSQGVAMTYRAAAFAGHLCQGVVVLGGDVPPELGERQLPGFPPVLLGRGDSDEWYDEEKLAADIELLESRDVEYQVVRYSGGHEWTDAFRQRVSSFLTDLAESPA